MSNITAPDMIRAFLNAIVSALKAKSPIAAKDSPEIANFHAILSDGSSESTGPATEGQPLSADERTFIRKFLDFLSAHHSVELTGKPDVAIAEGSSVPPHQARVLTEKSELDEKREKLSVFIQGSPIFGKLPEAEQDDLHEQLEAMNDYSEVLERRIARFSDVNPAPETAPIPVTPEPSSKPIPEVDTAIPFESSSSLEPLSSSSSESSSSSSLEPIDLSAHSGEPSHSSESSSSH